ncbi:5'-flap endonuclease [Ciborinia camelliae]|nr:5'-flap endonuclease [Ciborinia camelliae]
MATTNVYIISSSPPRQLASYNISSPPLPSLDEMFNPKKPATLRRGSGAASIPAGATATFSSASTLLLKASSESLQGIDTTRSSIADAAQDENETKKSAKAKAPRKTATKKEEGVIEKVAKAPRNNAKKKEKDEIGGTVDGVVQGAAEVVTEKKPRKPRAKKADNAQGEGEGVAEATIPGVMDAVAEKKTRKPRAKKVDDVTAVDVKKKAPRKPRAKKTDVEAGSEIVPKEKATRKPRAKKSDGDTNVQPKIAKGRVTKTAKAPTTDKLEAPIADTVSKHFAPNPIVENIVAEEGFGLVGAIKRRKNWTPAKPTTAPVDFEDSPKAGGSDTNNKGFAELLGSFGFSSNGAIEKKISSGASSGADATRKRKLIEMVTTNIPTISGIKAAKEKAVKKKARTLTDLATSAYAEDNEAVLLDAPAPLLQYFPQAAHREFTDDGFKIPPKPRSKSPVKGLPKSKKGSAEEPILLSPESALKQVGNQDFVFGTSSQLAREDSPSLLRDLHDAMQASNELDDYDDPFVSPPTKIAERTKAVIAAKRNLWSVAARDDHGDLMDIETVDLAHTPVAKSQDRIIIPQKPSSSWITPTKDEWLDIDEIEEDRPPSTQVPPRQMGPIEMSINLQLLNSPLQPNSSSKDVSTTSPKKKSSVIKSTTPKKSEASKMPDYDSFTTPQLSREIQKYKFKAIKSRKKMIDLLVQCYESQNRPALGVLQGNVPIAPQKPLGKSKDGSSSSTQVESIVSSTQTGRRRPKKATTATISSPKRKSKAKAKMTDTVAFLEMDSDTPLSEIRTPNKSRKGKQPVEDVSDSDHPITPSPPRRSPSQIRKASKALELSPTDGNQDDEAQQAELFAHISTAITSAPPSQDPSRPSWHEKILLYDPIVLEDLASWLNTGALSKVGWDGEVDSKEVKKWCESKSICCLWKENQGGGARSRY